MAKNFNSWLTASENQNNVLNEIKKILSVIEDYCQLKVNPEIEPWGYAAIKETLGEIYLLSGSIAENEDWIHISKDFFRKVSKVKEVEKVDYGFHQLFIDSLLFHGKACLILVKKFHKYKIEKIMLLREGIEIMEIGISKWEKTIGKQVFDYGELNYINGLIYECLYRFTKDINDIDKALSELTKTMEYDFNREEREEAISRIQKIKAGI